MSYFITRDFEFPTCHFFQSSLQKNKTESLLGACFRQTDFPGSEWLKIQCRSKDHLAKERPTNKLRRLAKQEFLVAAGNPKGILIFTAFFPQFVDPSAYAESFTVLGVTFLSLELIAISVYAAIGMRLGKYTNNSKGFRWFNRASGSMMVGFGLALALLRHLVF